MATIKVFSVKGVKELKCFDTLDNVPYEEDEEETIEDDGELTVGTPLRNEQLNPKYAGTTCQPPEWESR